MGKIDGLDEGEQLGCVDGALVGGVLGTVVGKANG